MGLSTTEIEKWEATVYESGISMPVSEMAEPPADWADSGVKLKATCPGASYCGNPNAAANCTVETNRSFKVPTFAIQSPFPPTVEAPPLQARFMFPPRVIIPGDCPNYPNYQAPPE